MKRQMNFNWRLIMIYSFISVLVILLTACNLNTETAQPTSTPLPSPTSAPKVGSITGQVWEDLCKNYSRNAALPDGCILHDGDPDFLGDGKLGAGEAGIPSAQISLGKGICPSSGFSTTTTDMNGGFAFTGLEPGEYCVTATDPSSEMGLWTYPRDNEGRGVGFITITVRGGEVAENVNFGRDRMETLPTPEPTAAPTLPPCTDKASYIRDVSIPDGTRIDPGETFTKTWRLRNEGTCTWNTNYSIVFVSGYAMNAAPVTSLLGEVAPGSEVDITQSFTAPMQNGEYAGFWKLRNPEGDFFGIGTTGESPFWIQIIVGPRPEPEITEWRGEYYDNVEFKGDPVLVRNDEEIDFDWMSNAPDKDLPQDQFAVRWTRTLDFIDSIYRFTITMDDGGTLWVDDRLVIDEWKQEATREVSVDLELKKGEHEIMVEYFEAAGTAKVRMEWERLDETTYEGWKGRYWFNRTLDSEWALVREDEFIDFDWKFDSPAPGIPVDDFSISWERRIEFSSGTYNFYARSDDGLRVYVDDALVIDEWHISNGSELYETQLELTGEHDISIQYYERKQHAKVQFWWERNNEAPESSDDLYQVDEGILLQVNAPGVLENDSDPDGDALSAKLEENVANGKLTLNGDGSFEYQPDPGFTGKDRFQYRGNDGEKNSEVATVTITVLRVNNPPEAVEDSYSLSEDSVLTVPTKGVLSNDTDPDGDPLSAFLELEPENGDVILAVDGSFEYTPYPDFFGIDTFTYKANDGFDDSNVVLVTITISAVNDVPQSLDDQAVIENGETIEIDVLENDMGVGDQPLELVIETEPEHGSVEVIGTFISYTPKGSFLDVDSFTYKVTDVDGESSSATVIITKLIEGLMP